MIIDLYHGSEKIIQNPTTNGGRIHNDYGQGFYCTQHIELAKEWAVSEDHNGYANHYTLDLNGLKILNLNKDYTSILYWLAFLLQNRVVNLSAPIMVSGMEYLQTHYPVDAKTYDLIIGYRADDSYFSFARDFLSNSISIEQLEKAMYLGELGEQYFIKSQKAFKQLNFVDYTIADKGKYYSQRIKRDSDARLNYQRIIRENPNGTYLIDLLRKEK